MIEDKGAILVTGCTSDIGESIVNILNSSGYTPILVSRNDLKLTKMAERLKINKSFCYVLDNNSIQDLSLFFKKVVSNVGKLSGLVICSGRHEIRPMKSETLSNIHDIFYQNTLSSLYFAKYFSSRLFFNDNSSLVFISSIASLIGEVGLTSYSASKGALISATRSLAVELASRKLRVNCISPGWVDTAHATNVKNQLGEDAVKQIMDLYPLGFGEPIDIAHIVEFLISSKSRWITGQNFVVDGGRTLL